VTGALSLLAGVLLGLGAANAPDAGWMTAVLLFIGVAGWARARRSAPWACVVLALVGVALASRETGEWQSLRIEPATPDHRVLLEGVVRGVPVRSGGDVRFDADVRIVSAGFDERLRRARLAWREPATLPRVGERWRWLVRLSPSSDTRNDAGLDVARLAFRDGIHLAGRVLPANLVVRRATAPASVDGARSRIAARIDASIANPDAAALVVALAVGLTDRLSLDQWRVFNATGTTHLVAISGLHVTLFALLAFAAARAIWRWLPWRSVSREAFAATLGLVAAGGYAWLSGFSVPAQRTWLMLAVFAAARLVARRAGPGRVWSLALVAVLWLDPCAPLAAGFWLSFVAVGVILVAAAAWTPGVSLARRAGEAARLQAAITLALAPLTLAVFDSVSIVGLAVNLVAIPVVSFVYVPTVLAGAMAALLAPGIDAAIFGVAGGLYDAGWPALVAAADLPAARWTAVAPAWWFVAAWPAIVAGLWAWPPGWRLPAAGVALPLIFGPTRLPEPGAARVAVLDVGRGSATLIATASHILLFDTGDGWRTAGSRIRQVVLPALDALGRSEVDVLVLPTLTPDRAAGAAWLAHERAVGRVVVGGGWPATTLPVERCVDGKFRRDGVAFEFFAHADRCVLRVVAGGHAVLLAGDVDVATERALVARLPSGALASAAVIVSRQASAAGSGREWIEESGRGLGGRLTIATGGIESAATRAAALARWRDAGNVVLDTRREGAIELSIGTNGVRVTGRARHAGYPFVWRRPP
jgi:competence protein ComEC